MTGRWIASSRQRRRNLLLLVGLVPSLIAAVVSVALLVMLQRQAAGVDAQRRGDHEAARAAFAANRWFGTVEHWVAPFNEGVATFGTGEYADALADFRAALDVAPADRQCLVLHNIAVTQERLGDAQASTAVARYRSGRSSLAQQSCLVRTDIDARLLHSSTQLDERLQAKIREALAEQAREDLAAMNPERRSLLLHAERLDDRAERREQEIQDESEPPGGPHPPAKPTGQSSPRVTYGW